MSLYNRVFGGKLERTRSKKDQGVSTVRRLIDDLKSSRNQAQEVIEEVDEEIDELEAIRDDAVEVRRFVDNLTGQFNAENE